MYELGPRINSPWQINGPIGFTMHVYSMHITYSLHRSLKALYMAAHVPPSLILITEVSMDASQVLRPPAGSKPPRETVTLSITTKERRNISLLC